MSGSSGSASIRSAVTRGCPASQMAAVAARAALSDAGVRWEEIDFAAGGSDAAGNADTTVAALGLTGIPVHQRQERMRDRGIGAHHRPRDAVRGIGRPGARDRVRQASARRVQPASRGLGPRLVVRRDWTDAHHAVLRHEDPALHERARDQRLDARQGRGEGVSQRRRESRMPGAGRRSPRRRSCPRGWSTIH